MGKRFGVNVVIHKDGKPVWFQPGDDVPEWAEGQFDEERCLASPLKTAETKKGSGEYDSKSVPQLIAIAAKRKITLTSNKKSEIIEVLEEQDAALDG